ncbi:MAG: hypothetical protein ACE5EH_11870 [Gammaproteobacteria bacterium]
MAYNDALVEQQILEYESRRKHFDELLEKAEQGINALPMAVELSDELTSIRQEREKFLSHIDEVKEKTREDWQENTIEEGGPIILWEAVAKRLEALLERIEQ